MLTALIIAAALSACGGIGLALIGRSAGGASARASLADASDLPPALISLVLTKCAPGIEAYEATILDLAARGLLAASAGAAGWQVTLPAPAESGAAGSGLADFEQRVLHDVTGRLHGTGSAPFEVLADACRVDVRGSWDPFQAQLMAAARRRGICRPALPTTAGTFALATATTAAIAACGYLAARLVTAAPGEQAGTGGPVVTSVVAVFAFWTVLSWLGRPDRLTALGSALAGQLRRDRVAAGYPATHGAMTWGDLDPAGLLAAARAVAAGVPLTLAWPATSANPSGRPVPAGPRRRSGRPAASGRPDEVWSSFSGTWRPVRIRLGLGLGMGGGFALLGAAAWAGVIAYAVSIPAGTGALPLILGCVAITLAVLGVRLLARLSAMPAIATFDGQVVARWLEEDNSENGSGTVPQIAVDDAERAWAFAGWEVFNRVALGDLVQVTVNPRSGKLIDLRVTSAQRPQADVPREPGWSGRDRSSGRTAEPLITDAEIAALVGPLVRTTPVPTPGDHAVIWKGRDGTMSLVVIGGSIAAFDAAIGRRLGHQLAGIGDQAWLLNRRRTVIVRTGPRIVKITVNRRGRAGDPGQLCAIAAGVARRLAGQAATSEADRPADLGISDTTA